jgi:Ca-activated chloride channel family protein
LLSVAFAGLVACVIGCGDGAQYSSRAAKSGSFQDGAPSVRASTSYDKKQEEEYSHFEDNPFKTVAQDPVSTFSVDVNTASYSNVRRMLNNGQLPPKDAVRIADFINYFPYSYPRPSGEDPVAFALDLAPCPWEPTHHLLRVGLMARQLSREEMPPRNLVFLIDVSGSMTEDSRLPLVKRSLNLLIGQLAAQDTVSIVTYANGSAVKLPPTSGSQKSRIREVVNALTPYGGTNGEGGIRLAYDQARAAFIEGGANRVILCTDGDFNVGVTSEGELVRLIEEQRRGNVFLTVLGYGMGNLKNATLEKLANHGNGHYAYVDSEAEAHKVFVEQGAALVAVAKDVKLQVEFNPQRVQAYRLIGYENRVLNDEDFADDAKDAGDLGSGHTVTAFYQVVPAGVPFATPGVDPLKYQQPTAGPTPEAATGEWLTVKMRYKHPESAASLELAKPLAADALAKSASSDFRFAAAVAEFGLLLRDSPYKGRANYDRVLATAEANLGPDPAGHRAEFTSLVRKARQHVKATREEPGR